MRTPNTAKGGFSLADLLWILIDPLAFFRYALIQSVTPSGKRPAKPRSKYADW